MSCIPEDWRAKALRVAREQMVSIKGNQYNALQPVNTKIPAMVETVGTITSETPKMI